MEQRYGSAADFHLFVSHHMLGSIPTDPPQSVKERIVELIKEFVSTNNCKENLNILYETQDVAGPPSLHDQGTLSAEARPSPSGWGSGGLMEASRQSSNQHVPLQPTAPSSQEIPPQVGQGPQLSFQAHASQLSVQELFIQTLQLYMDVNGGQPHEVQYALTCHTQYIWWWQKKPMFYLASEVTVETQDPGNAFNWIPSSTNAGFVQTPDAANVSIFGTSDLTQFSGGNYSSSANPTVLPGLPVGSTLHDGDTEEASPSGPSP